MVNPSFPVRVPAYLPLAPIPAAERVEEAFHEITVIDLLQFRQVYFEATACDSIVVTSIPLLPRMRRLEGG